MIFMPRIGEQCALVRVAGKRSSKHREDVLLPVVPEITERNAVSFLQMSHIRRSRYVLESLSLVVSKEAVRKQCLVSRVAGPEIHVEPPVIVQIASFETTRER